MVKLLADCSAELPKVWIRYPESIVDVMVVNMVDLMSMGPTSGFSADSSRSILYPSSLLALADPRCKWLASWTHGRFGRKLLFR